MIIDKQIQFELFTDASASWQLYGELYCARLGSRKLLAEIA